MIACGCVRGVHNHKDVECEAKTIERQRGLEKASRNRKTRLNACTCLHTWMYTYKQTYIHTHLQTLKYICIHTNACICMSYYTVSYYTTLSYIS